VALHYKFRAQALPVLDWTSTLPLPSSSSKFNSPPPPNWTGFHLDSCWAFEPFGRLSIINDSGLKSIANDVSLFAE